MIHNLSFILHCLSKPMPNTDPSSKTTVGVKTISRTKIAVAVGLCGLAIIAAFATGTIQKSTKILKSKLKPAQASSIAPLGCQFLEADKNQETVNQKLASGCRSKKCTPGTAVTSSLWWHKTKTDTFDLYCIKLACKGQTPEPIQCKVYTVNKK